MGWVEGTVDLSHTAPQCLGLAPVAGSCLVAPAEVGEHDRLTAPVAHRVQPGSSHTEGERLGEQRYQLGVADSAEQGAELWRRCRRGLTADTRNSP